MTDKTLPRLSTYSDFAAFRSALIDRFGTDEIQTDSGSMDMLILEWAFDAIHENNGTAPETAFFDWQLESINCAGCHAPSGLIYNHDIAAKFAAWWDEIDTALEDYRDNTGESFAPETCGHLVWFAVEWRADALASLLHSEWEA